MLSDASFVTGSPWPSSPLPTPSVTPFASVYLMAEPTITLPHEVQLPASRYVHALRFTRTTRGRSMNSMR